MDGFFDLREGRTVKKERMSSLTTDSHPDIHILKMDPSVHTPLKEDKLQRVSEASSKAEVPVPKPRI
jgi:hypothetical protein